jgi:hypothetical protein
MKATTTPVDYLGNPCKFHEAKTLFEEPMAEAKSEELREIKRSIGRLLLEISKRLNDGHETSSLFCDELLLDDNIEAACSFFRMKKSYELETCQLFYEFARLLLEGFERLEVDSCTSSIATTTQGGAA